MSLSTWEWRKMILTNEVVTIKASLSFLIRVLQCGDPWLFCFYDFHYLRAWDSCFCYILGPSNNMFIRKWILTYLVKMLTRNYSNSLGVLVAGTIIYIDYSSLKILTYLSDRACLQYSEVHKLIKKPSLHRNPLISSHLVLLVHLNDCSWGHHSCPTAVQLKALICISAAI